MLGNLVNSVSFTLGEQMEALLYNLGICAQGKKGNHVSPDVNMGFCSWSDNSIDIRAFTKLGIVFIICHADSIPVFEFTKVIGLLRFKLKKTPRNYSGTVKLPEKPGR